MVFWFFRSVFVRAQRPKARHKVLTLDGASFLEGSVKKITGLLTFVSLFGSFSAAAGGSGDDLLAKRLMNSGMELLVSEGVCSSVDTCLRSGYVSFSRANYGVEINYYEIKDGRIALKILSDAISKLSPGQCGSTSVMVYRESAAEYRGAFIFNRPEAIASFYVGEDALCIQ